MDEDARERPISSWGEWSEYRRLILAELERISHDIKSLNDKVERFRQEDVSQMKTDIALLKFQAALWGATAGVAATGIISFAVKVLRF